MFPVWGGFSLDLQVAGYGRSPKLLESGRDDRQVARYALGAKPDAGHGPQRCIARNGREAHGAAKLGEVLVAGDARVTLLPGHPFRHEVPGDCFDAHVASSRNFGLDRQLGARAPGDPAPQSRAVRQPKRLAEVPGLVVMGAAHLEERRSGRRDQPDLLQDAICFCVRAGADLERAVQPDLIAVSRTDAHVAIGQLQLESTSLTDTVGDLLLADVGGHLRQLLPRARMAVAASSAVSS